MAIKIAGKIVDYEVVSDAQEPADAEPAAEVAIS